MWKELKEAATSDVQGNEWSDLAIDTAFRHKLSCGCDKFFTVFTSEKHLHL